jgi:prevent-host-death family protein
MEKFVVKTISVTKARINLGEVIKRVHLNKENFVLEKGGIPVAAILDIDKFEDWLEMKDPKIKEQIRRGFEEYKKGKTVPPDNSLSKIQAKNMNK